MSVCGKVCTQCGELLVNKKTLEPRKELYDEELFKKSNIIRLVECQQCERVADRYIECEGVQIIIDMLLQFPEAYRHVLFNGSYMRLIFKMALITVICDGYIRWAFLPSPGEFFEEEYVFYVMCGNVLLGLLSLLLIPLIAFHGQNASKCLLGLVMAYSVRVANLAAFLWAQEEGTSVLMWLFFYVLFFLATVRSIQVTQSCSILLATMISFLAHIAFNLIVNFDAIVQNCPSAIED